MDAPINHPAVRKASRELFLLAFINHEVEVGAVGLEFLGALATKAKSDRHGAAFYTHYGGDGLALVRAFDTGDVHCLYLATG